MSQDKGCTEIKAYLSDLLGNRQCFLCRCIFHPEDNYIDAAFNALRGSLGQTAWGGGIAVQDKPQPAVFDPIQLM